MYATQITVPINTTQSAPAESVIRPVGEKVNFVKIRFPDGCAGLVGVRVSDRGAQFAPYYGWVEGNAAELTLEVNRELTGPPYEVVVQAYNLDDTNPHTVEVRLT